MQSSLWVLNHSEHRHINNEVIVALSTMYNHLLACDIPKDLLDPQRIPFHSNFLSIQTWKDEVVDLEGSLKPIIRYALCCGGGIQGLSVIKASTVGVGEFIFFSWKHREWEWMIVFCYSWKYKEREWMRMSRIYLKSIESVEENSTSSCWDCMTSVGIVGCVKFLYPFFLTPS